MTGLTLTERLRGHQFCLLTTFRKDGRPVPTPMWFAVSNGIAYMSTPGGSAKVKRLRRDPRVTIGPSNGSGTPLGEQVEGRGRVVEAESEEAAQGEKALRERYGLKRRLLLWAMRFARDSSSVIIAVALEDSAKTST